VNAAVIVALIALVGAVGNVGLTYWLTTRKERRRAQEEADAIWARQRHSLVFAASELSARIHNILENDFLAAYGQGGSRSDEAIISTLFRFSQYFGWSEIVRRATRVPDERHRVEVKAFEELQSEVGSSFSSDRYGPDAFMVWRESQRAIGELMISQEAEIDDTIGVAAFLSDYARFKPWLHRMEGGLKQQSPSERERERLVSIQGNLDALSASSVEALRRPQEGG
jgi:hypothetical protein